MTHRPEVRERIRQARIIAGALMGGVGAYTIVAVVVVSLGILSSGGMFGTTFLGFVALFVLLLLVLAPILRRRVLESGRPADADEVLRRWMSASIVGLAVREGAGLFGVTIALVAGATPWILAFGLASLVAMGLAWPRADEVEERIRRVEAGL